MTDRVQVTLGGGIAWDGNKLGATITVAINRYGALSPVISLCALSPLHVCAIRAWCIGERRANASVGYMPIDSALALVRHRCPPPASTTDVLDAAAVSDRSMIRMTDERIIPPTSFRIDPDDRPPVMGLAACMR